MTTPPPNPNERARRVLALPSPAETDEHCEQISPFDDDGAPNLSDVSPRYLRELARAYTREALETLLEIMRNRGSSDTVKITCAKELLLRGWGSPGSEAELLKIWLDSQAAAIPPTEPEPIRFVMPMTVDGNTDTQDT